MSELNQHEGLVDGALLRAAEYEMRRTLQHPDSYRASKRAKKEGGKEEGEEEEYLEVGRFNYSSVKDIANGMTCFLATCDFRREKSTTREVTSLLKPYLLPATPAAADKTIEDSTKGLDNEPLLSNLKVSCRGLILLKLNPPRTSDEADQTLATAKQAQQAVLKIYENTAASATAPGIVHEPPEFIQRLVPILSTCALEAEALRSCAARVAGIAALEFQHAGNTSNECKDLGETSSPLPLPPTFGIHINNREFGAAHAATSATPASSAAAAPVALERMQIINAVAAGLTFSLKNKYNIDAKVNLKAPTIVVDVEVVPIMGKAYAGIAILPQKVCTLKPKLGIKALRQGKFRC